MVDPLRLYLVLALSTEPSEIQHEKSYKAPSQAADPCTARDQTCTNTIRTPTAFLVRSSSPCSSSVAAWSSATALACAGPSLDTCTCRFCSSSSPFSRSRFSDSSPCSAVQEGEGQGTPERDDPSRCEEVTGRVNVLRDVDVCRGSSFARILAYGWYGRHVVKDFRLYMRNLSWNKRTRYAVTTSEEGGGVKNSCTLMRHVVAPRVFRWVACGLSSVRLPTS